MNGESKSGMQCLEFDALLAEALDGILGEAEGQRFEVHRSSCASCGPMFAEAAAGRRWLRGLEEVEPPANLEHNILAATIGQVEAAPAAAPRKRAGLWDRFRDWGRVGLGPVLQPRFAMSFGMAFFSVTLLLNLAGVKASDLRHLDLRPSSLQRTYYETAGKLVKYYENIRFVYEIESRVQQLKRATSAPDTTPAPEPEPQRKNHSGEPNQKQYQNYSRETEAITIARLFVPSELPLETGFAGRMP